MTRRIDVEKRSDVLKNNRGELQELIARGGVEDVLEIVRASCNRFSVGFGRIKHTSFHDVERTRPKIGGKCRMRERPENGGLTLGSDRIALFFCRQFRLRLSAQNKH